MADIITVETQVIPQSGARFAPTANAGEAITAGQVVYKKKLDGKWYLTAFNDPETSGQYALGISVDKAGIGQPLQVQIGGDLRFAPIVGTPPPPLFAAGSIYVVSDTGGFMVSYLEWTAKTALRYLSIVGYATTGTLNFNMDILKWTGVVIPSGAVTP